MSMKKIILAAFVLISIACQSQTTIKVDTLPIIWSRATTSTWQTVNKWNGRIDTTACIILISDSSGELSVIHGFSVNEIHNEMEWSIDWYFDHQRPPEDYRIQKELLDENKKHFPKSITIWQTQQHKQ